MPDFTIVTASYNYGHYIGECLGSVASQQGVTFEHLVMDGGSTDDTEEVVGRYSHANFFQEPDKGMTDAINKGFRRANGKWVMWLNADDRLKPGALAAVIDFAKCHPEADVIHGGWDFMDDKGDKVRRMSALPYDFRMLVQYGCYIGSTSCYFRRATTIDEGLLLDDRFKLCMDGEYFLRLGHLGKKFVCLPKILADFRLHDESISQSGLNREDLGGVLRHQRLIAEPRALRRVYGVRLFRSEPLNGIIDGLLFELYRLKKGWMKFASQRRCMGEPGD